MAALRAVVCSDASPTYAPEVRGESGAGWLTVAPGSPDICPKDLVGEAVKGVLEAVGSTGLPVVEDEADDLWRDELLWEERQHHEAPLRGLGHPGNFCRFTHSFFDLGDDGGRLLADVLGEVEKTTLHRH